MQIYETVYNANTRIWRGKSVPLLYHKNVSIGQIILTSFDRFPDRVVQISENNEIEVTTDQLKIRSIRVALHMAKLNLTSDDCIGIIAMNNHHLAPIVIGALLIGVPVHPLDPLFDNDDISHFYNLSKPAIIFCDYLLFDRVKLAVGKIGLNPKFVTFDHKVDGVHFVEEYFKKIDGEKEFIPIQIEDGEKSIALIMCSSGTTGLSKAVCLSHAQITHKFTTLWPLTTADVYMCFSSIYWITGIVTLLYGSICCCTRIITTKRFTPELFLRIVEKYRITQVLGPPSNLGLLLQYPDIHLSDVSSIVLYACGGATVSPEYVVKSGRIFKNCKISSIYGMTEIAGIATFNCSDNIQCVGYLTPNLEIKIIDDDGNKLQINEDGEIVMRSVYNFLGYKGDPELTTKVLNTDGWIYSGDIGHIDENGLLFIVDRKKDLLKYKNFVISPSEIEQFLLKQKFVRNACVIGIPDKIGGDLPAAVILKSEHFNGDIVQTIHDLVKGSLADYKQFRGGVYILDEFPMTPSGKIKKHVLREIAINMYNIQNKTFDKNFILNIPSDI